METVWLTWGLVVAKEYGGFGLILFLVIVLIWAFFRNREKTTIRHYEDVTRILSQYKDDVSGIKRLYENNVHLVQDYGKAYNRLETLYSETIAIISLNTQTQTHLADQIKNNMYCPMIREKGPNG